MSASETPGNLSRIDRWLDEHTENLLEKKRRLEATYYQKRAERAENRGNLEAAEEYYDRARSLRGRLGDREAAIDLGMRHARVARENGNLGVARKHYERVVELHARRENAKGALDAVEPLLEIAEEQGDDDALSEWWGHTLMILGKAEPGDIDEERRDQLVDEYAEQIYTEDSAGRLYGFATQRFLEGNEEAGADLLDATWDRRDVVREEVAQFRVLLAAGVARAAYAELSDREVDRDEVLELVAEHRELLSEPATVLFDRLHEGETDADPEEFRMDLDPEEPNELRDVESEVFGRFLEELE